MDDWKSEIEKRDIQFKSQEKISDLQCSSEIERMTFKWTIHKLSELQQMAKDPVLSGVYKLKTPVYTIVKEDSVFSYYTQPKTTTSKFPKPTTIYQLRHPEHPSYYPHRLYEQQYPPEDSQPEDSNFTH
eukprot:GHVP01020631.1.p1 GENE.GHVP01020631.1~~GHVP01020631.1.p1  ORF type:complete len:129 (-),score=18.69 GHVP01020631.1:79-465(-)